MKSSKQQSANFRRALHAEKAREAYIEAKRGGIDDYRWEPEDLSLPAPTPSLGAWWEMEVQL